MSADPAFYDELRGLIAQGEIRIVIERLTGFLKGLDGALYDEILLHAAKLKETRVAERKGTVTAEQAGVARARLSQALLDLIDDVSACGVATPIVRPAVDLQAPSAAALEKILGTSRLKSIAWVQRGLDVSRSVCRVVTRDHLGSGFLCAPGLLMTNHHVLPDAATADRARVEFNYQEDVDRRLLQPSVYELDASTLRADAALDAAVVAVRPAAGAPPPSAWGALELAPSAKFAVGDHVTIVQHPAGGPKQIAMTANQIVNVYGHRLQYTTDTLPGSSGSPVFDDDWRVIALHHAGGNLVANERGDRMFANEGVLIGPIAAKFALA